MIVWVITIQHLKQTTPSIDTFQGLVCLKAHGTKSIIAGYTENVRRLNCTTICIIPLNIIITDQVHTKAMEFVLREHSHTLFIVDRYWICVYYADVF